MLSPSAFPLDPAGTKRPGGPRPYSKPQKVGNRIKKQVVLGFPLHCPSGLRLLGFQLLGFYLKPLKPETLNPEP